MYFNGAIDGPTSAHLYEELIEAAKEIGLAEANAISQSNVNEIKAEIKKVQADINDMKKSYETIIVDINDLKKPCASEPNSVKPAKSP